VVDVSLSRIGDVQLDGLVHKKKIDLIVRTENNFPEKLRNDLRNQFHTSMEEVRYTGTLMFHAHKQGWIDLKSATSEHVSRQL
jgi:hypothetical protein